MPDYSKSKIYAIRAPDVSGVYIGSTTKELKDRFYNHKAACKLFLDGRQHNISVFEILKHEGAYIELIENFPCDSVKELNRREGEIMALHPSCVNRCLAGRTLAEYSKEWEQTNSERRKEYKKLYAQTHREELNAKRNERRRLLREQKENKS